MSRFGNRLTPPAWLPHQYTDEPPRVVLLSASQAGYQNLSQLITRFKMRETTKAEGAATVEDLEEFSAGLICLTGGDEGHWPRRSSAEVSARRGRLLSGWLRFTGAAICISNCSGTSNAKRSAATSRCSALQTSLGLPVIATNGVRYAKKKTARCWTCSPCIRHHTTLDRAGRLLARNDARHLRTAREMAALFRDIPEAIANTRIVSERLEFTLAQSGLRVSALSRCRKARRWTAFWPSAWRRACASGTARRRSGIC